MKEYIIYAGVNGSGKSTIYGANALYIPKDSVRINADEELVKFKGDWRNPQDVLKAGKITTQKLHNCLKEGLSINQETTLSGRAIVRNIVAAKKMGYNIKMFYISLDSPETAIERVHNRIKNGGHGIPDEVVESRFVNSIQNLIEVIPYCDEVHFFDNTNGYKRTASIEKGKVIMLCDECPEWTTKVIKNVQQRQSIDKMYL